MTSADSPSPRPDSPGTAPRRSTPIRHPRVHAGRPRATPRPSSISTRFAAAPARPEALAPAPLSRPARERDDGAPPQSARHGHPQGRKGHRVPRHLGVREVLARRRPRRRARGARRAATQGRRPRARPATPCRSARAARPDHPRPRRPSASACRIIAVHTTTGVVDEWVIAHGIRAPASSWPTTRR